MSDIRLFIIVPGEPRGPFASFLTSMALQTSLSGISVNIVNPMGSDLVAVRTTGIKAALEHKPDYVLWVDSDILMPSDSVNRLLQHKLPVVAASYVMKTQDFLPVTFGPDGQHIYSLGKTGLEKVNATGLGFVLTDAKIYEKMRWPWFGHRWFFAGDEDPVQFGFPQNHGHWSASFEDAYFSDRIRQAGYDIWVDHDLSLEIGHFGGAVYYHDKVKSL